MAMCNWLHPLALMSEWVPLWGTGRDQQPLSSSDSITTDSTLSPHAVIYDEVQVTELLRQLVTDGCPSACVGYSRRHPRVEEVMEQAVSLCGWNNGLAKIFYCPEKELG